MLVYHIAGSMFRYFLSETPNAANQLKLKQSKKEQEVYVCDLNFI